ncbi:MAG: conjugal transfer protein [Mesorhizobium sp.]|uniref:TrbI/VirB10 family protein n=6 Tax=Mesorhizobium TaxID=68287 RepID=UPI000FE97A7A|nr:TrbI/VirB10 family protein [Mesorhizobium sp.]RWA97457.1 MAG: conjugal transfer protein [Mesorhizobium sp.]RWN57674.1 MAG: conjugal transfer protein [Mesorhizobium sp.]RWO22257.1 MAG: conjugal transfer protein [Mesorhizobium sp.]RWO60697.1 MAG: conjugal transfer protein [Mesorhizobium sp.]
MTDDSPDIGHRQDPGGAETAADAPVDPEREKLLKRRRARQTGKSKRGRGRELFVAAALLASAIAFGTALGPMQMAAILGLHDDDEQKASQVDLEVDRLTKDSPALDFSVPEAQPKAIEPKADEIDKRFDELRKKIDQVVSDKKQTNMSAADVQELLERYGEQMVQRLRSERDKIEVENARLRGEALRLEEERKGSEEAAKLNAENHRQFQEIDTKQRESNSVVMDESRASSASVDGVSQRPQGRGANDRSLAAGTASEAATSVSRTLPDPSRMVAQGTMISAVLETAINTELPGNIRAQVIEPVFSFDGSRILLPAGTRLIGTFGNRDDIEQERVLIGWDRALTPDGKSIALGSTGTDLLGRAGTEGNVDNHYAKKIGAAVLISTISALPSIIPTMTGSSKSSRDGGATITIEGGGMGDTNRDGQVTSNVARTLSDQSEGILNKYLSLPPVLRVPQGEEIHVFVNRDLIIR